MTIRNLHNYVHSLWDWGFLDDCFTSGIRISDLDGIVERNGWVLVLEAKGPNASIPRGQAIMFKALAQKGFTILVIWGEPNEPEALQVWYPHKPAPQARRSASEDDVKDIVRRWFNWANANGDVNHTSKRNGALPVRNTASP